MPRIAASGGEVSLPKPLAPSDVIRIRRIFDLQAKGDIPAAISETGRLDRATLLGAILADRYLRQPARATLDDLGDWLARYGEQSDAPAIRALAAARRPQGAAWPPAIAGSPPADAAAPQTVAPATPRHMAFEQTVRERARAGQTEAALLLLDRRRGLPAATAARLRAEVARSMLARNQDAQALAAALSAMQQSRAATGLAGTVAGLAAWRTGRPAVARSMFQAAADAGTAADAQGAAAAFWAARTYLRTGDAEGARPWLRRAAAAPRTFYGLLARRALGMQLGVPGSTDVLSTADVEAVGETAQGARAYALLQVGQTDRAEAELRALWPQARQTPGLAQSLLLVARKAGLPGLAAEVSALLQAQDGAVRDDARLPRLAPRGGFRLDPALVYALTRMESNFDPAARSGAGARGLMQIMPQTASYIAGHPDLAMALHDPGLNLELGQRYVLYLAQLETVAGSLIHLLASYNAGPGNVQKWSASSQDGGDPLLFIETIPNDETRAFVQGVLTYSWIYAARLGLASPSLDELARGAWPRFRQRAPGPTIR